MRPRLIFACLLALCLVVCASAWGQPQPAFDPADGLNQVGDLQHKLSQNNLKVQALNDAFTQITALHDQASVCVDSTQKDLLKVNQALEAIGEPAPKEPREVADQRKNLLQQKGTLENRLASCRLLVVNTDNATSQILSLRRELMTRHLLHRGPDILMLVREVNATRSEWQETTRIILANRGGTDRMSPTDWAGLGLATALCLALGLWSRRALLARALTWEVTTPLARVPLALMTTSAGCAPYLLPLLCATVLLHFLTANVAPPAILPALILGPTAYVILRLIAKFILLPRPPAVSFTSLPVEIAQPALRRFSAVAAILAVGLLLVHPAIVQSVPEPALILTRTVVVIALCAALLGLLNLLARVKEHPAVAGLLRVVLSLVVLITAGAELLGYRTVSAHLLRAILGTFALGVVQWILLHLVTEAFDGIIHGDARWQRVFRYTVGLVKGTPSSNLQWFQFVIKTCLWLSFGLAVLWTWGMPRESFFLLYNYVSQGIEVGGVHVVPLRLFMGILLFSGVWALSRWLKHKVERKWLAATQLSHSSREATATIFGYVAFLVSVMLGLSVAGMDLSKLALIAGALSVGIGFGLQNIVNNFVSGLILLFERPIKTGDWIVVGETEGYVKRISVRSTIISTFDRSDVIVPNSELISSQVTNWMLDDLRGRVRVPVGVAYGSDTALVKKLLIDVATAHPEVITDGSLLAPYVLFMDFGDSSLDFELRFFVRNVDLRFMVKSDINFAIDATFREHGVEIPFPQRDLHVINWPKPSGDAPGAAPEHPPTDAKGQD